MTESLLIYFLFVVFLKGIRHIFVHYNMVLFYLNGRIINSNTETDHVVLCISRPFEI